MGELTAAAFRHRNRAVGVIHAGRQRHLCEEIRQTVRDPGESTAKRGDVPASTGSKTARAQDRKDLNPDLRPCDAAHHTTARNRRLEMALHDVSGTYLRHWPRRWPATQASTASRS